MGSRTYLLNPPVGFPNIACLGIRVIERNLVDCPDHVGQIVKSKLSEMCMGRFRVLGFRGLP